MSAVAIPARSQINCQIFFLAATLLQPVEDLLPARDPLLHLCRREGVQRQASSIRSASGGGDH